MSQPNVGNASMRLAFLSAFLLLALTGCGYRFGGNAITENYRTISVPFVKNDPQGDLTGEIVRELSRTGTFRYCRYGGELTLCADLIDITDENIGYRYERELRKRKEGEEEKRRREGKRVRKVIPLAEDDSFETVIKKSTIPDETRMIAIVEITLVDTKKGCTVLGPVRITAQVDFDHDYYTSPEAVNVFSLGQLTDIEQAREAALPPLYQKLAHNIVEYIRNVW